MIGLPTIQDRTMVIGATGEGKTVGAMWLLSRSPFHEIPYVIIDYKRELMIAQLEEAGASVIYDNRRKAGSFPSPPVEPGLYIVRPDPDEREEMNAFLSQIWRNGNTGIFCDEAFMIPQKRPFKAFDNILTTGRSLNMPLIMLYQRPVDMSQYATSQAEYWMVFNLRKPSDIEIANQYIGSTVIYGRKYDAGTHLRPHYWMWYDVHNDGLHLMQPVPPPARIMDVFRQRLRPADELEEPEKTRPRLRLI